MGDLFDPPKGFLRRPMKTPWQRPGGGAGGQKASVTFFSYANCFPYSLISEVFKFAATHDARGGEVRLLTSKEPVGAKFMPKNLKRQPSTGQMYAHYERIGGPNAAMKT